MERIASPQFEYEKPELVCAHYFHQGLDDVALLECGCVEGPFTCETSKLRDRGKGSVMAADGRGLLRETTTKSD